MKEAFLHFLWKNQYFDRKHLKLSDGSSLEILHVGTHNTQAGPDFSAAYLRIAGKEMVGNVEIHLNSNDWRAHQHHKDKNYDNIILHVIWFDTPDLHEDACKTPFLALKNLTDAKLYERYLRLLNNPAAIACDAFSVQEAIFDVAKHDAFAVRLHQKVAIHQNWLQNAQNDWLAVAQKSFFKAMGMALNDLPFEWLANAIPYKILLKHSNQIFQLEALLFGQAGFLSGELHDDYQKALAKEYLFLAQKYNLTALDVNIWKFAKIRPAAFPTLKIAHLAVLASDMGFWSDLLRVHDVAIWKKKLKMPLSAYWQKHYSFGKMTETEIGVGNQTISYLIINGIAYLQAAYHQAMNKNVEENFAKRVLEKLPHEGNRLTKYFKDYAQNNAFDSQAEIALFKHFCSEKNCLSCKVGKTILKSSD